MTWPIRVSAYSPDLRFAMAGAIAYTEAFRGFRGANVDVTSFVPAPPAAPAYLRYADRDAVVVVHLEDEDLDVETELAERIHALGQSGELDDLALAVLVLNVVDACFRQSGLWDGSIYLVDEPALTGALEIAGASAGLSRDPMAILRELAALELVYLFPVASKFRARMYDGQVQYRLNGWGRALARRLAVGRTAAQVWEFRRLIGRHLTAEYDGYAYFLRALDVSRESAGDLLLTAMALPIPVLV